MADERGTSRPKVARLIDKYELDGIGDELEHRWTRAEDRSSLRDLATYFNQQLVRAVLEAEDADPIKGEVQNLYDLLTGDETTSGVREEARHRLEERGADVAELESDFVSYQSIRTYLKKYRHVELPNDDPSLQTKIEQDRKTLQRVISRLASVTEQTLWGLENREGFTLGDFDVLVTVRIHCSNCNSQKPITEVLNERGCECD
jgi:hypothetical protein